MSSQGIKNLVKELSPEKTPPDGWDRDLPRHCSVELDNALELIVAQSSGSKLFAVSLIETSSQQIRSTVVSDFSENSIRKCVRELRAVNDSRSSQFTSQEGAPAPSSSRPNFSLQEPHRGPPQDPGLAQPGRTNPTRDPNAPPGFEDEHRLTDDRPQPSRPFIEFDPDQDLYPPGGRYPQLGPNGPFNPFDPLRDNPRNPPRGSGPGPGRGMHPEPFGSNPQSFIHYDPPGPGGFGSGGLGPF